MTGMKPIEELGLDGRVEGALVRAGIEYVEALEGQLAGGDDAVLDIDGIGAKSLEEIKAALAKYNVDPEEPVAEEIESDPDPEPEPEPEPQPEPHRSKPVMVRVVADMGILAGKAVWKNERHRVAYGQYKAAKNANPDGFVLELDE